MNRWALAKKLHCMKSTLSVSLQWDLVCPHLITLSPMKVAKENQRQLERFLQSEGGKPDSETFVSRTVNISWPEICYKSMHNNWSIALHWLLPSNFFLLAITIIDKEKTSTDATTRSHIWKQWLETPPVQWGEDQNIIWWFIYREGEGQYESQRLGQGGWGRSDQHLWMQTDILNRRKNIARLRNCPNFAILKSIYVFFFCLFVFLPFCLFLSSFLSFCLFV